MTRALRDIPAVRALAEREARALYERVKEHMQLLAATLITPAWDAAPGVRCLYTEAMLDLLCDLTRPASRDAVARLVAESVGLECGATAPAFWSDCAAQDHSCYWLDANSVGFNFCALPRDPHDLTRHVHIPALAGVTNPAEALALIADAVLT